MLLLLLPLVQEPSNMLYAAFLMSPRIELKLPEPSKA